MEQEPEGRQDGKSLTLTDGLRLVRRYWIGIIALVALSTAVAFGWYSIQPKMYAADSSGIVVAGGADNLGLSLAGDNLAKAKVKSYKSVAESLLVANRVVKDLGLTSAGAAISGVSVTIPADTAELHVSATSTDPAMAQKIADEWVVALAAQVRELEQASSSSPTAEPAVRVVPLAKASLPGAPVSPNLKLTLGIGAAAGLLLGLGYALLRGFLDRRIRTASEAERTAGHPVIGTLPNDARLAEGSHILDAPSTGARGSHAMGEALRELRTNLQFIDVDNPPRILLVTSSVPSEGKSTVIGNLAATMASAGENVVVVDGDLRRPTVHEVFGVVPGVGLTDVLAGRATVDDVLQSYPGHPNLRVLGAGRIPPNPSELLGSRMMSNLLTHLAEDAVVLVDAPPLLPVTDAAVLSRSADGTIIVARVGRTTTDSLERAVGNLERVRGKVLGIILNGVSTKGPESYTYGYYGTYSEHQRGHEKIRSKGKVKVKKARPASAPAEVAVPAPAYAADQVHAAPAADFLEQAAPVGDYRAEDAHSEDYGAQAGPDAESFVPDSSGAHHAADVEDEPAALAMPVPLHGAHTNGEVRAFPPPQLVVSDYVGPDQRASDHGGQADGLRFGSSPEAEALGATDLDAAEPDAVDHESVRHEAVHGDAVHGDEPRFGAVDHDARDDDAVRGVAAKRQDRSRGWLHFTTTRPQPIISPTPLSLSLAPEGPKLPAESSAPSVAAAPNGEDGGTGVDREGAALETPGKDAESRADLPADDTVTDNAAESPTEGELWLPVQVRGRRSAG
ncbi:polysaccharide biosynthesis tyrosine autokinase [Sinomonas sp. P10A9]|uniref:Polysaccharide biosynthesis tyrosine autokinase n=1 Tax=Sinomonas puerhi TaxID=3238584 RepID=A0AB39L190_9MICC